MQNTPSETTKKTATNTAKAKPPSRIRKSMDFFKKGIKSVHSFGQSTAKVARKVGKVTKFVSTPLRRPFHTAVIVFIAWWGIGKIGTEYNIPTAYDHDSAAWVQTTEEAINKVEEMTPADFHKMDHAELYGLIRMIHGHEKTDNLRAKMLLNIPLDPDYVKYKSASQRKLHDWLATSPTVREAAKGWDSYTDEERLATLRLVAAKHSAIYGYDTPPIFTVPIPIIDFDFKVLGKEFKHKGILMGGYNPVYRFITLNNHKDAGWGSFSAMLNTTIHENTHSMQAQLGHKLLMGKIDKTDPRFDQARLIRYNVRNYANTEGYNVYKSQPMERETFKAGDDAAKIVILNHGKSKGDTAWEKTLSDMRKAKLKAEQKEIVGKHSKLPRQYKPTPPRP